ncbi:MAG TPA: hypothetical protein VJ787_09540 [Thermoleophilia bacterium]|nr:hypothetical protein [Thermoleophilia bacterium]
MGINDAWINAKDYPTIQAAIDALPAAGGVVIVPPGDYDENTTPAMSALTLPTRTILCGSGIHATKLLYNADAGSAISMQSSNSSLRDFSIVGPGTGSVAKGIVVGKPGETLSNILLDNVAVVDVPECGLYFMGGEVPGGTNVIQCSVRSSHFQGVVATTGANLRIGTWCTTIAFADCGFGLTRGYDAELNGPVGTTFDRCVFETGTYDNQALVKGSLLGSTHFNNCWFETHGNLTHYCVDVTTAVGLHLRDCYLARDTGNAARLLNLSGNCRDIVVESPTIFTKTAPTATDDIVMDVAYDANNELTVIGGWKNYGNDYLNWPISVVAGSNYATDASHQLFYYKGGSWHAI